MMIRILKTSHGHPFYRASRSTNRKWLKEGRLTSLTCQRKVHNSSNVRRPVEVFSATGRQSPERRTKVLGDRSTKLSPYMNFDSTPTKDASYASIASMANGSFCKACPLGKLGSRPSYAKDTKETIPFLHRIQGRYLWTHPTINADFWDNLWFWWIHRHTSHMSLHCPHTMLLMPHS
jgi:hypothetical protein